MERKLNAHRIIGLICRYPKHKWRLKVRQFLELQAHSRQCYECNDRITELLIKNPKIGPPEERN